MNSKKSAVGFVTCSDLSRYFPSNIEPLLTQDDQVSAADLRAHGYRVEPVVWGTPIADLRQRGIALLVVRSPWDYMDSEATRSGFFNWLDAVIKAGMPLLNTPEVMLWNLDKHYLGDLAAVGVPIVPTDFIEPDQNIDLAAEVGRRGAIVIKPAVSAAAKDTHRLMDQAAAAAFDFDTLRHGRSFLLQPYLKEVTTRGEWSLVFLDGSYSHAVLKLPGRGNWLVQDELGGSVHSDEPPAAVRKVAEQAWEALPAAFAVRQSAANFVAPLYGRVDVLETERGNLIGEFEMVEPELFFTLRREGKRQPNPVALERFRAGLVWRLERLGVMP